MKKKYSDILKREADIMQLIVNNTADEADPFSDISANIIAPVIYMFTCWIISEAEKKGIDRLYFFSRDGYLMEHIAENICRKRNNGIVCSYFYCSRYSLRMASYRFKDDCAYEKLFYNAYRMSASLMLKRAGFSEYEMKKVYSDIHFSGDGSAVMGRNEFSEFCSMLKRSSVFNDILVQRSDDEYEKFVSYVHQEELDIQEKAGVIDLGWNGSMQYSLRKLLDSMGSDTELYGFYFGLMSDPPSCRKNHYYSWLFGSSDYMTRAWFAHNLLECMCSAPHGMTLGYEENGGKMSPVMAENENTGDLSDIIKKKLTVFEPVCGSEYRETYKKTAHDLLHKLMFSPDRDEAETLSRYCFCDDVAEQYHGKIAERSDGRKFRKEILPFKLFYTDSSDGFYWFYGSAVLSDIKPGLIYRSGYLITRYLISRFR